MINGTLAVPMIYESVLRNIILEKSLLQMDKHDAFTREKYLKTGMGKRYLKNRLKRFLSLTV